MSDSDILGDTQDLFNAKVNMMVSKRALPDVVAFLIGKRGAKQAEEDLRDIAKIITQRLLVAWMPKERKPYKVFKEMMNTFFNNNKIKGKILERRNKRPSKIALRDYNCPICPEQRGEEVEISEIHYCIAISGTMEGIFGHLIDSDLVPYTHVQCQTVKSKGSGDKYCEHHLTLKFWEGP